MQSSAGPEPLVDLCWSLRERLGAAACSVAVLDDAALRYLAADGEGAAEIVGTRLDGGRGVAGFVVAAAQSVYLDEVAADPRFARDVAESTGYVPTGILAVPVVGDEGILGVLTVLDPTDRSLGDPTVWLAAAGDAASEVADLLEAGTGQ
ncbi:MAG: GAF domain-containing protein [Actinomycetes bacterium]